MYIHVRVHKYVKGYHTLRTDGNIKLNRRFLLAGFVSGSTVLIAGCMGDDDNNGSESTESEPQPDDEEEIPESPNTEETNIDDNFESQDFYDIDAEQVGLEDQDLDERNVVGNHQDVSDHDNALSVLNQYSLGPVDSYRSFILVMEESESPQSYSFVLSGENKDTTNQTTLNIADETIVYQTQGIRHSNSDMTVIESRMANIYIKLRYDADEDGTFEDEKLADLVETMWSRL